MIKDDNDFKGLGLKAPDYEKSKFWYEKAAGRLSENILE